VITGDFFTRFNPFFIEGVRDLYAARGIILKPVDLADLVLYGAYDDIALAANRWGLKPGNLAFAKACMRIFQPDGKQYRGQVCLNLGLSSASSQETSNGFLVRNELGSEPMAQEDNPRPIRVNQSSVRPRFISCEIWNLARL
jgi:hypothetical protein